MSNKVDATDMEQGNEREMKPRLRFPEFRDAPEWSEKQLGEIGTKFLNGGTPSTQKPEFWEGKIPWITGADVVDQKVTAVRRYITDEAVKNSSTNIVEKGSLLVVTRTGVGKVAIAPFDLAISQDLTGIYIKREQYIPEYLYRFFDSNSDKLKSLNQGTSIAGITREVLMEMKVPLPSVDEQQKIADCLSSLDEMIATHSQKLGTLKVHKKGLLQQLFPAEGQTLPQLRFPEFQDAPEWEEKKFGEICNLIRGPFGGSLKKDIFVKDGYAVYEQSHAIHQNFDSFRYYITKEKFTELKRFSVHPDDIIMSCSGTMGKFAIIPKGAKSGVINQALLKLTAKKGLDIRFIKAVLELPNNQEQLLSQSAGGAIKNVVSVGQIKELDLYVPSFPEQQKIADCLASIDDLIAAQSQKLDALKAHKRGLMQQLFPSPDEVQG